MPNSIKFSSDARSATKKVAKVLRWMADTGLPLQRVRSQIDTSSSGSGGAPASPKKYERGGGRMGRGFAPTTLLALVALVCVGTWRYMLVVADW